ncbi:MAG: signal peptidase I [Bacteroidetes bacterium]|nr:MAG: signal peptidase I [Bacteroidota bacterium]
MDSESMFPEMGLGITLFYIAVMVVFIIAEWRIYEKGGQPGWAVLIPFYNLYVLLIMVGRPWWWLLLMLIPGVNFIVGIIVLNDLSKSFGQGVGFTLGLIFLSPIFILLLGFGDFKYIGPGATM